MDTHADATPSPLPRNLHGLKFFSPLEGLLGQLHSLYPDPKRLLHYDDYLLYLLLAFYEPAIKSMRALQEASALPAVRECLGVPRFSLGSFSEAGGLFEPEYLRQIFLQLAAQVSASNALPRPQGLPQDLSLVAFDGTLWSLLPRMAPWFYEQGPRPGRPPGFKAHVQFDILKGIPVNALLTDGYTSERRMLEETLEPHTFYLIDAGLMDFLLFQAIINRQSHFLIRARSDTVYQVLSERPLSAADEAAGVLSDTLVRLGSAPHADKLKQPLRVIRALVTLPAPHNLNPTRRHGKRLPTPKGQPQLVELVLITSDLDMSAELLVQLYRYRWQIELFFRWFKCVLNCRHFFSESESGMALQVYAALIATLLVVVFTGLRPTRRLWTLMNLYLNGWASSKDVQQRLAEWCGAQKKKG